MIRRILLGCPLIENLHLFRCTGLRNINVSEMHNLRNVIVVQKDLKIEFEDRRVRSVLYGLGQVDAPKFRYLSSLMLHDFNIDNMFFHEFSYRFPCLEDLTLADCHGYRDLEISSDSLKCISLTYQYRKLKKARFYVPSIRKFKFVGINFPSLSFVTASREWESDIKLFCWHDVPRVPWFRKLKKFLAQLSVSRISLSLYFNNAECDDFVGGIQGFPPPVVENLMVKVSPSVSSSLLNGLFWSCRPKFITQYSGVDAIESREMNRRLLWLLRRTSRQKDNQNCVHDLEKAIPEFYEETLLKWQPFPLKAFFASKIPAKREQIRFRLTWGHFSIPKLTMAK
ncbi:hypothetical protein ACJIZ3_014041 [Penstemon smallii]|uniref:Uncharacterized protein n=1 Tax=Penstemon smallii TaxID=265156 RepID=A0ABD3RIS2_9LAMI